MMKWENLKSMKCPRCLSIMDNRVTMVVCNACHYGIKMARFNEIVGSMYGAAKGGRSSDPDANLAELNNMGRDKISHDDDDNFI